jgi:hypothetical protein
MMWCTYAMHLMLDELLLLFVPCCFMLQLLIQLACVCCRLQEPPPWRQRSTCTASLTPGLCHSLQLQLLRLPASPAQQPTPWLLLQRLALCKSSMLLPRQQDSRKQPLLLHLLQQLSPQLQQSPTALPASSTNSNSCNAPT